MSQHPYARTISPLPDPLLSAYTIRRTISANGAQRPPKPHPEKLPAKLTGSMTELHPVPSSTLSIMGPQYRRHFVKQESFVTLVLSGHNGGADKPVYTSGSLVRGLVTISKPEGISSIVVNLEGSLRVRELQNGGSGTSVFLSETLYTWNSSPIRTTAPTEFNFETLVPIFISPVGDRRIIPPTYEHRIGAVGSVSVQYEFVLSVSRHAGSMEFWKKRTRLRVPFVLKPLTRPQAPGPFPANVSRHSSERPKTIFLATIRPHLPDHPPIELQVFLPQSQVIPAAERIVFRLAIRASSAYLNQLLAPPASGQPLSSFLPIPSLSSDVMCSFDAASDTSPSLKLRSIRQPRFALRLLDPALVPPPVSVRLERRVAVDAREPSGIVPSWVRGRGLTATEVLAEARLHREKHEEKRLKWWGAIDVPLDTPCAGFVADRLSVQDFLVVSIDVPGASTHENPFRCHIPVRLTSHSARAVAAVKVGDAEVRR